MIRNRGKNVAASYTKLFECLRASVTEEKLLKYLYGQ